MSNRNTSNALINHFDTERQRITHLEVSCIGDSCLHNCSKKLLIFLNEEHKIGQKDAQKRLAEENLEESKPGVNH